MKNKKGKEEKFFGRVKNGGRGWRFGAVGPMVMV
jgi:hypothetical protein